MKEDARSIICVMSSERAPLSLLALVALLPTDGERWSVKRREGCSEPDVVATDALDMERMLPGRELRVVRVSVDISRLGWSVPERLESRKRRRWWMFGREGVWPED